MAWHLQSKIVRGKRSREEVAMRVAQTPVIAFHGGYGRIEGGDSSAR